MRMLARLSHTFAFAIVLGVGLALAFAQPRMLLGTLVGDDAGYYLAIARNAAAGHGFSFDRLHPTNGFNPLMPLVLIPLDRLLAPGLGLVACMRVGVLVTWVAMLCSMWSLRALARRVLGSLGLTGEDASAATGAVLLLFAGFVAVKGYYGMDAFLVLAFGLAWLERVARLGLAAPGGRGALADGALLGLAVLARVDSLPLVLVGFAMMITTARASGAGLVPIARRALVVAAFVLPYLVWNRLAFGDWLPISARLKSAFPHWRPAASLDTVLHSSLNSADVAALFLGLGVAAGWCLVRSLRRGRWTPSPDAARAMVAMDVWALYLTTRLTWLLLFSRMDVQGSYFILVHAFLSLALLVAAHSIAGVRAVRVATLMLALGAVGLALAKWRVTAPAVRAIAAGDGDEWAIARHVHDATRDGDVIYGGAYGLIGYIADRPWINGDGVANDRGYQEAIRDGTLAERLAGDGVDYVALTFHRSPVFEGPLVMNVESVLYGATQALVIDPTLLVLRERLRRGDGSELWLVRAPDWRVSRR